MDTVIIAIDGQASTGKSTQAKKIALYLDYDYRDSGAYYRAITLYLLDNDIKFDLNISDEILNEISIKQTRINDAKVDPYGGIVFGTYNEDPDKINRKPIANLYRLAPDLSLTHLLSNITVSNGIAFSQNENIMYFADTPTGLIRKFEFTHDFKKLQELESNMMFDDVGEPDGATVDINNNYWSARVRGKCILCLSLIHISEPTRPY